MYSLLRSSKISFWLWIVWHDHLWDLLLLVEIQKMSLLLDWIATEIQGKHVLIKDYKWVWSRMSLELRFENKKGRFADAFERLFRKNVWVCWMWEADEKRYIQISHFERASGTNALEIHQIITGSWFVIAALKQLRSRTLEWRIVVKWKKNESKQFPSKKYSSWMGKILYGSSNIDHRCSYYYSARR